MGRLRESNQRDESDADPKGIASGSDVAGYPFGFEATRRCEEAAGWPCCPLLEASLYRTGVFAAPIYLAAVLLLALALVGATVVPVRRALRVSPLESLRAD